MQKKRQEKKVNAIEKLTKKYKNEENKNMALTNIRQIKLNVNNFHI